MFKKGKYKLFSYIIEDYLIYYKSLKKSEKIIAFAICEYLDFKEIETILNDFLRTQVIHYCSIQIAIDEKREKVLLLNFEDYKKENIIRNFNNINQILSKIEKSVKFLRDKLLETKFLSIFLQDINSNTFISKTSEAINITTGNELNFYYFYIINLDLIETKKPFITDFVNFLGNFGGRGFLIFNFQIDTNKEIIIFAYFVDICETGKKSSTIENKINNLFHCALIIKQDLKIQETFNFVWRLGIIDKFYFFKDFCNLFSQKPNSKSLDLININDEIEENLVKNQIEYLRLSPNLLFIEYNYLFILLENLDPEYVHQILKDYYPKYVIYILILNNLGYMKLLEMNSIQLLKNIKIINPKEIQKLKYQEFKKIDI